MREADHEGGDKRDSECDQSHQQAVGKARGKGHVINGVDLGGEGNEVVVAARPGNRIAEHEPDGGADHTNQHTLCDEDATHLGFLRAHGHENSDVFGFFHDHHDERDEDVERGDEDDEADGDEGDDPFETQGAEESLVRVVARLRPRDRCR